MKNLLIVLALILGVSIFYSCSKTECETCAYTFSWEDPTMIADVPSQLLPADTEYCDEALTNHKEGWVDVVINSAECEICTYTFSWVDVTDYEADDAAATVMNGAMDALNSSASGYLCGDALIDAKEAFSALESTETSGAATMDNNGTPDDTSDDIMTIPGWVITMDCIASDPIDGYTVTMSCVTSE
tara:strand:- start:1350 stop:1910 length:561 start_codon:yes stop_codon:yes gene_type:complete